MDPVSPATYGIRDAVAAGWAAEPKLIFSLLLAVGLMGLRWLGPRLILRGAEFPTDRQRRAVSVTRNGSLVALLAALLILWLPEVQDFALSLAAVAVALVIATKELLMCFAGTLMRSLSGAFSAGDWIEVNGRVGEVSEHTLVSTTLLELDPERLEFTGRSVALPNSVFLSATVTNLGFRKRYVFHQFTLWSEPRDDVEALRAALEAALAAEAAAFRDVAQRYASLIETRMGVHLPAVAPSVRVRTSDLAKIGFEARLFCPRDRALEIEAAATAAFFARSA